MPKLPMLSGQEAAKAFAKAGFVYDHHSGSHMIYYHPDGRPCPFRTTVNLTGGPCEP